jgi:PAS domain S-box-containing protein
MRNSADESERHKSQREPTQRRDADYAGQVAEVRERERVADALRRSEACLAEGERLSHTGSWAWNVSSRELYWSQETYRIFGLDPEKVKPSFEMFFQMLHPEERSAMRQAFENAVSERTVYETDYRIVRSDGSVRYIHSISHPTFNSAGELTQYVGTATDTTERRHAEAHLSYQAKLLDYVHDAILATDDELNLTAWNRAAEEIYGWKAEEVAGRKVHEVIRSEFTDALRAEALKALAETGRFSTEVVQFNRDGRRLWIQGDTMALRDEVGRITGYVCAFRDISERRQAEEALRESEERYRDLFENANDIIYIHDLRGNYTSFNKAALKITGYTREEALRLNLADVVAPWNLEQARQRIAEKVAGRVPSTGYVLEIIAKDGSRIALEIKSRLILQDGVIVGIQGIARDISERMRAEEALRKSEAYLAEGQKLSHTGSGSWNVATGEMFWSQETYRIYGFDPPKATPSYDLFLEIVHPEDRLFVDQSLESVVRERSEYDIEFRIVRPDGSVRYIHSVGHPVINQAGDVTEVIGSDLDVTERKQAEEERRQLLRRLMAAQEEERKRIARELHDQLGQQVCALSLKLSALKRAYGAQVDLGEQIDSLQAITKGLVADVDFLVRELRPTALDDHGLLVALTTYVKNWSKHFGIQAETHTFGMEEYRLSDEIESVLYRVTQEALTNIAKHARAGNVAIVLEHRNNHVSLIVEDDGKGFDVEQELNTEQRGAGLIGIHERVTLVGGTVEIESKRGDGVTVIVRIPTPRVSNSGELNE